VQPPAKLVQLIWRRYYESGHPVIDTKHRALFDNANKVLSAVLEDRQTADVAAMMDAFIADIAQHFREEEAILAGVAYPAAAEHAAQHRALLDKAVALAARVRAGTLSPGELFEYLAHEVVARHILIADREFFHALSA
jgi:hemerythrin-like metal-binding protein